MIVLSNVTKRYGHTAVLDRVTLTLSQPGVYCLLGRNGAGKTTLLKSIAGQQSVTDGSITVNGQIVTTASLDTGVSYIENFAKHFNLPVRRLLSVAADVNPGFDTAFALEMMERFELSGKKKFGQLSLGMKTMVSTIICLASSKPVVLLDEPVLGLDAFMRAEFYDMLAASQQRRPRVIVVSTHIIEEIAKTITHLIILDRGRIRFFDAMQAADAYSVSGLTADVEAATAGLRIVGQETVGGLTTRFVLGCPPESRAPLTVSPLSLQELFIQIVRHKEEQTK